MNVAQRQAHSGAAAHPVDLDEAWPGASKHVDGRKRELVRAPHEEAAKDAAVHVALLRLAREGVAEPRAVHQQRVPCRQPCTHMTAAL